MVDCMSRRYMKFRDRCGSLYFWTLVLILELFCEGGGTFFMFMFWSLNLERYAQERQDTFSSKCFTPQQRMEWFELSKHSHQNCWLLIDLHTDVHSNIRARKACTDYLECYCRQLQCMNLVQWGVMNPGYLHGGSHPWVMDLHWTLTDPGSRLPSPVPVADPERGVTDFLGLYFTISFAPDRVVSSGQNFT